MEFLAVGKKMRSENGATTFLPKSELSLVGFLERGITSVVRERTGFCSFCADGSRGGCTVQFVKSPGVRCRSLNNNAHIPRRVRNLAAQPALGFKVVRASGARCPGYLEPPVLLPELEAMNDLRQSPLRIFLDLQSHCLRMAIKLPSAWSLI